jgi:hypothetical protein
VCAQLGILFDRSIERYICEAPSFSFSHAIDLDIFINSLLMQVDEEYALQYTALAVTLNFVGSPHIDTQNIGPFYGMALGDFSPGGGALCVEYDPFTVAHVDTRARLGKVDGRYPHWVAPYTGNRYSLIFYNTEGVVVPQRQACYSELVGDGGVGDEGDQGAAPTAKRRVGCDGESCEFQG